MNKKFEISKIEIKKLYWNEKLSISEIAKKFGISYWLVWNKMNTYGIKRRNLSEANILNNLSRKISILRNVLKNLYLSKRLPTTKIAKMFNCHHSVILRRMKEYGIKSRSLSEAMVKYPKKDFEGDALDKAYLIGFRYGDLYIRKTSPNGQTIKVECSTTRPEQIKLIDGLFNKYGHRGEYKFKGFREEKRIYYHLNSSFKFLLKKNKKIDNWILNSRKNFFAFLAGYTDAEGNIGVYERGGLKQAAFVLSSYDKEILKQIRTKLISEGINCGNLVISSPKGYTTLTKPKPYRKDYWSFGVYSKKFLLRLFHYIQLYLRHPKSICNLNKATKNINWRNKKFGNLRMK